MDDKLMYIPIDDTQITLYLDYNQWLNRLDTQSNEPTNQNLTKVLKLLRQRIIKHYCTTLVASVINAQCPLPP